MTERIVDTNPPDGNTAQPVHRCRFPITLPGGFPRIYVPHALLRRHK